MWPFYVTIAILSILVALLSQVRPFMVKAIIDEITSNLNGSNASPVRIGLIVGIFVGSRILMSLFNDITGYLGDNMSMRMQRLLTQRYYEHLLQLPQTFFDDEQTGKLINRLNRSITDITNFVQSFSNNFLSTILSALVALIIIAYYSWPTAIIIALLFPVYLYLTKRASKVYKEKQDIINKNLDEAHGRFTEVIGQIRVVKSFVQEQVESVLFSRYYAKAQATKKEQSWRWHSYNLARNIIFDLIITGAIGFIGWQALRGRYSVGEFTLLLQLIIEVSIPLFFISFLVDSLQRASANSKDYFEVMAQPVAQNESSGVNLKVKEGQIEYQNVSFAYNKKSQVLKNISFSVPAHSKVALIGQSGEGKTTIANLLLHLYSPTSGAIKIDDQDITDTAAESLRRSIGVVFQDASLFSGTVRENIAYGRKSATDADVIAAAKAANAHEFIQHLPRRYNSTIGERGIKLSGGQKQRIAIARALLKDPPILILDEATSSLDAKAEQEVQKALEKLMQNRTTLIIAHRLSTIKHVDTIVALKNGRVAEVGSPRALAKKKNGIYAELLRLQDPTAANKKKLKEFDILSK